MISFKQICWCNAYLGSTKKSWNNNMSLFIAGIKMDVFFFKLQYIKIILEKVINIIRLLSKKKKFILFVIPELVLLKSILVKPKIGAKNIAFDLKNLTLLTFVNWVFGILTNFKCVNKNQKVLPINYIPNLLIVLLNKITEDSDYAIIAREGARLGLLTIGLIDSHQNPYAFDYAIPSNSKSFDSSIFYYRLFMCYLYIYNLKVYSTFYFKLINQFIFERKIKKNVK